MAPPAVTVAHVGKNHLRFLIVGDGTGGNVTFTTTGLAGSVETNLSAHVANNGPLNKIVFAFDKGYGQIGPDALTQAQSRGLFLNDQSGTDSDPGPNNPSARCLLTRRGGTGTLDPAVDADVDGSGNPTVVVAIPAQAGSWYLDIEVPGAIGD